MSKHKSGKKGSRDSYRNAKKDELRLKEVNYLRKMASQAGIANAEDLSDRMLKITLGF